MIYNGYSEDSCRYRTLEDQRLRPFAWWVPVRYIGEGDCPLVLQSTYHNGTRLNTRELKASAKEGALPAGTVYKRLDGAQWLVVWGKPDRPQRLLNFDPGRKK